MSQTVLDQQDAVKWIQIVYYGYDVSVCVFVCVCVCVSVCVSVCIYIYIYAFNVGV